MVLKSLKQYLEKTNYTILIKSLIGNDFYSKPWKTITTSRFSKLTIEKQELVKLFYCGQAIAEVEVAIKDAELIKELLDEQVLIKEAEGYLLNHHRIITYMGLYIMIDAREDVIQNDHVWFGEDSIFLSNILPYKAKGKALDLCTGSGIHALILGSRGMDVKAVELNEKAIAITKQNIILNDLEDKVAVVASDLFEGVKDEKFDLIVSNPPFLPMLKEADEVYFFADGGLDGLKIIRRIVNEMESHLTDKGKLILIGGGYGDEKAPYYANELQSLTIQNKWHTQLILIGQNDAKAELERLGKSLAGLDDATEKSKQMLQEDVQKYYSFILVIDKENPSDTIEISDCSQSLQEYMRELRKQKRKS